MLKELFEKSLDITKTNLILVQPLLIFLLVLGMFMQPLSGFNFKSQASIVLLVSLFALCSAFLSGWLYMFHKCIEFSDKEVKDPTERAELSMALFKEFMPGIGKYFPKMTFSIVFYILVSLGFLYLIGHLGQSYIGIPDSITPEVLREAFISNEKAIALIESLTDTERQMLQKWNLFLLLTSGLFSYLTMFFPVAIVVKDENPLKAIFTSIKAVLKRPSTTFGIFMAFYFSSIMLAIFNSLSGTNFLLQLVGLMLSVFLTVYFMIVIFLYFEKYSESNSSSWSDSFR